MGAEGAGVEPETNPEVERLLRERRAALSKRMPRSERRAELWVALTFLVAAGGVLAVGGTAGFDPVAAVVVLVAYAAASRVRFEIGGGSTDPTLLVLVPALFLEPPAVVPLLVAAGFALGRLPEYLSGRVTPDHVVFALGNSWHAIGPALVLALTAADGDPDLVHAGWYVLAFVAYVAGDAASGLIREWLNGGARPSLQLRLLARVYALDALLAPAGLLAALADASEPYAFLLVVPLVAVLGILARERTTRLDHALALSESRTRLLEAELAATRIRVEVLGAVSHGLQTPLAGIVAIAGVMARRGRDMDADALTQAAARLHEDAVGLRQLARQGLDYVRLMEGADLGLRVQTLDATALAGEVAARTPGVRLLAPGGPVAVRADAARLDQVLTSLVARAARLGVPPAGVTLGVAGRDGTVAITVAGGLPLNATQLAALTAPPDGALGTHEAQGTGIDLYVAAAIARALDGALAPSPSGGGLTLTLPAG
ncbi:MAG: metal dependent phosphohydrolase [Solirubrobacterales bacterium]|nr:metal dependent phosphohydrolase [Solirubrobacterales bacterium]